MNIAFLYPASGISPHKVHLTWAKSVGSRVVETPMGIGFFDINKIRGSDLLLLESLYCAPFAKRYKKKNPDCQIISIIADTSFWPPRLSIARKMFYRRYLGIVDGFLADSSRIKKDILSYIYRPVAVVRPFVNRFRIKKRGLNKALLFIGNEPEEKGYKYLVRAMDLLPDFELFLVGDCGKKVKARKKNIHVEGKVPSLKKYFEKCSFYVHPADFEPFGVAPLEAMHVGLIPIITKDVGLSEMFDKELKKLLVLRSNAPDEIARKVLEIYNLKNKEKIIKKCKALSKNWTKEKSVKLFKKSFFEVLSKVQR